MKAHRRQRRWKWRQGGARSQRGIRGEVGGREGGRHLKYKYKWNTNIRYKYNANTNTKGELGGNMMRYRGSGGRRCVAGVGWVAWELRLDPTQPPRRGWDPGSVVIMLSWLLNLTLEDIPRYVGICIRSGRPRRRWYNICPEELLEIICYQDLKEKLCQPDFHLTMPCTALVCNCAAWRYDCQTDDNGGFKSN